MKHRKIVSEEGELLPDEDRLLEEVRRDADASMLRVTRAQIAACIADHEAVLTNLIRDRAPPCDGGILVIVQTIEVLKALPTTD